MPKRLHPNSQYFKGQVSLQELRTQESKLQQPNPQGTAAKHHELWIQQIKLRCQS
jgi:hypothetical protein